MLTSYHRVFFFVVFVSLIGLIALEAGAVKIIDASTTSGQDLADKGSFKTTQPGTGLVRLPRWQGLLPSFDVTSRIRVREGFFELQFLCSLSSYEVGHPGH